jgi:hypothetical protein
MPNGGTLAIETANVELDESTKIALRPASVESSCHVTVGYMTGAVNLQPPGSRN